MEERWRLLRCILIRCIWRSFIKESSNDHPWPLRFWVLKWSSRVSLEKILSFLFGRDRKFIHRINTLKFTVEEGVHPLEVLHFLAIRVIIFRILRLLLLYGLSLAKITYIIDVMVSIMSYLRTTVISISRRINIAVALLAVLSRLTGNFNHFSHEKMKIVTLILWTVRIFAVDCFADNFRFNLGNQLGDEYFESQLAHVKRYCTEILSWNPQ